MFDILPQCVSLLHGIVLNGSTVTQISLPLLLHIQPLLSFSLVFTLLL